MADVKRQTRAEKAAATRKRMLDAAYELFCEVGFRAATMDAIAQRAGVAVQTLYFTFHTKDELVQAVHDRTVLGDDGRQPPEQPWFRSALARDDVADAVADIVGGIGTILARVAPMVPAFQAVAGDEAGAVWRHSEELRLMGMRDLVGALATKAPLRRGLGRDRAADALYALCGPHLYRVLVLERGWTQRQWEALTTRAVLDALFDRP